MAGIPQTKRSTYRRMTQMNGDNLTQLKRPVASEFGKGVIGHNNAKAVEGRKRVELWYKEKDINVGKMKRKQDGVYHVLLKVHKDKKIIEREMYKRKMQELREKAEEEREAFKSKQNEEYPENTDRISVSDSRNLLSKSLDPLIFSATEHDPVTSSSDHKENDVQNKHDNSQKPLSPNKLGHSRVLEVQRDPQKPLSRERSHVGIQENSFTKHEDSNDQLNTFRSDNSSSNKLETFRSIEETLLQGVSPRKSVQAFDEVEHENVSPHGKFVLPPINVCSRESNRSLPAIAESNETAFNVLTNRPLSDSRFLSVSCDVLKVDTGLSSDDCRSRNNSPESKSRKKISQIELNKRHKKEREERRKRILDAEGVKIFQKDDNGKITLSNMEYKRRSFSPPSLREKHFQQKMLKAQQSAILHQNQRMGSFFGKLEVDKEREEYRPPKLETPVQEEKSKKKNVHVSLSQMMAAFARSSDIPENVDPSSVEALKYCGYLRDYHPDSLTDDYESRDKVTSWGGENYTNE